MPHLGSLWCSLAPLAALLGPEHGKRVMVVGEVWLLDCNKVGRHWPHEHYMKGKRCLCGGDGDKLWKRLRARLWKGLGR